MSENRPVTIEDLKKRIDEIKHTKTLDKTVVSISNAPVKWEDIGGLNDVKRKLQESAVWFYKHTESFKRLGISPPTGILLYGPPGTGKTMLARAVATESSARFLSVSISDMVKAEVGESEKALERLFEQAQQLSPSIIFIDELDALFGTRGGSGSFGKKLISQITLHLDNLKSTGSKVVVLAATNTRKLIDHTILRSGDGKVK
ncbi:hypothetical protein H4219_001760 [Mycoemilia scoparia]|uniref:AAA+ ATPase domain-containing protein n=1 Tax=Mycoemilia scoparia TaxID=417184 RepID=A0A9W8DUX4_9FUNG|nr:hypothetical protein H4219_001760 [Mycoemilia scoparia]